MRNRTAWLGCGLLVAATALATAGCGLLDQVTGGPPSRPAAAPAGRSAVAAGGWTRLPDPPLSLRTGPVVAWAGGRLVVVGGYTGIPCPPGADCAIPRKDHARDGAAFDPATGEWTTIAMTPVRLPEQADHSVVGNRLFIHAGGRLLRYDPGRDDWTWERIPGPDPAWLGLESAGDRLLLVSGSDEQIEQPDRVLDTRTGTWSVLPDDPFGPSFDRSITATPAGLVLVASSIDELDDADGPTTPHVARLDPAARTWTPLPDTEEVIGGYSMVWTGTRLVDPTLGGADGGETNNYGRVIPYGGRLDPDTGVWSALPDPPDELTGGWPVWAPAEPLIAVDGWLYADDTGTWTWLTPPEGAPQVPGPATFAQDQLYVVGGSHDERWEPMSSSFADYTRENVYDPGAWVLAPAAPSPGSGVP